MIKTLNNYIKNFKKAFFNYILFEIELKNVENQIEKRKIGGKWEIDQNKINNDDEDGDVNEN